MADDFILLAPYPRITETLFSTEALERLMRLGTVRRYDGAAISDADLDRLLPQATATIGLMPLTRERIGRAPRLRAVMDVMGGGFNEDQISYEACRKRGIHVLGCAPAFADSVAEMALGMALALARGIVPADAAFRSGSEIWGGASNLDAFLLTGKTMGLIGCGNVGRRLVALLKPFGGELLVYDPWVDEAALRQMGCTPCNLMRVLSESKVVFIAAKPNADNRQMIGRAEIARMKAGTVVVLIGRAAVVDVDALLDAAGAGRIRAAIDVWPEEPVASEHRARRTPNVLLSAHRAGGTPEAYRAIGDMVVADLDRILRGQEPVLMQRCQPR